MMKKKISVGKLLAALFKDQGQFVQAETDMHFNIL